MGDIIDGTSNTIVFGEQQSGTSSSGSTTGGQQTTGITDGTSNTILISERFAGVTQSGAAELLRASMVTNPEDRRLLSEALLALFGDGSVKMLNPGDTVALLPAVQKIRDAVKKLHPGLVPSVHGVIEFLSGNPVINPHDRKVFAYLFSCLVR